MVSGGGESGGLSRRGPRTQRRDRADLPGTQVNLTELQVNIVWLQVNSAEAHRYQHCTCRCRALFIRETDVAGVGSTSPTPT